MDPELLLAVLGSPKLVGSVTRRPGLVYRKSLALLCYLAVARSAHSRDSLAGLLWGEASDVSARASLRKTLSDLRRLVGSHLIISRHSVQFDCDNPIWLDHQAFCAKLHDLDSLSPEQAILPEAQCQKLIEAVDLYRGEFLDGFYVHDAPAFEEWVLTERERMRSLMMRALYRLVAHYAAQGLYSAGISYGRRLLSLEPWHEEVNRQLMLLLALRGQRSAALQQYQACWRVLAEEFGIEPSKETTDMYLQIRSGEISPSKLLHRSEPAATSGSEVLPSSTDEQRASSGSHLVTLDAFVGAEKIELALGAAAQLLETLADGVHAYPISLKHVDAVLSAIASTIGSEPRDSTEVRTGLLDLLHAGGFVDGQVKPRGLAADLVQDIVRGRRRAVILISEPAG